MIFPVNTPPHFNNPPQVLDVDNEPVSTSRKTNRKSLKPRRCIGNRQKR